MLSLTDRFYALRFLRLLTTPWEKTGAFKAGIVDENGKILRKAKGREDKKVYNIFHKLVYNIKRLINKVPAVGKSTLASYAAALYLIKEHTRLSDKVLTEIIKEGLEIDPTSDDLNEESLYLLNEQGQLGAGNYEFCEDMIHFENGDIIEESKGRIVTVTEERRAPIGTLLGYPIFKLIDADTGSSVIISNTQLNPITY